jgi:hypothetical protein
VEGKAMPEVIVPTIREIEKMSYERCQSERIRLKNEISFARGNALWGGPSKEGLIATLKSAIDAIERRVRQTQNVCTDQHSA